MKNRYLGDSGLLVSRVCLGTMNFLSGDADHEASEEESKAIMKAYVDAGGNFIDTADGYGLGASEQVIGRALKDYDRQELVLATKVLFPQRDKPNFAGLSRGHIVNSCERSLKALQTDYIDLFQIHGPDPFTPIEETLSALDLLVKQGKVRYIAFCNLYAWQLMKANNACDTLGIDNLVSGQYLYNLIRRDIEVEIIPALQDQGMGLLCWSPLGSGMLTGKYKRADAPEKGSRISNRAALDVPRYWHDRGFDVVEKVVEIAEKVGKSPVEVSLAWLLKNKAVTSVIVGPRSAGQLELNLGVADWDLDDESYAQLNEVSARDLSYPAHWVDAVVPRIPVNLDQ